MPRTRRTESSDYKPVRRFLESERWRVTESVKRGGSIRRFVGRGYAGLIVDVSGVRETKGNYSRSLEGIAVEVKRSRTRTSLRNLVQASQYGRLAHRCYLAQPRRFDLKTINEASRLGVGLMEIRQPRIKVRTELMRFFTGLWTSSVVPFAVVTFAAIGETNLVSTPGATGCETNSRRTPIEGLTTKRCISALGARRP